MVYLSLGSNLGDRRGHLARAVAALRHAFPGAKMRLSSIVTSESWGYSSPNAYLNQVVEMALPRPINPFEVLRRTQAIERRLNVSAHRRADGTYADRQLDIDIIAITGTRLRTPRLTLPHPRAHLRPFVIQPLRQLLGTNHIPW